MSEPEHGKGMTRPTTTIDRRTFAPPPLVGRLKGQALLIGAVAAAVAAGGYFSDPDHFFRAYLVAFLFWAAVALGSFALAMLHHLTRGAWGLMIRRPAEAASRTLPFLALLFVPVALGIGHLYEWSHAEVVAADAVLAHKASYLNAPFFVGRAIFYFAVWLAFMWPLNRLSLRQDETGDPSLFRRMQVWAAPGLVLYALTGTLASVDWMMSLDPHWYSSIYGMLFVVGQALSGLVFVILVAFLLSRREPMGGVLTPRHFHDLGKLLLAFVMFWAYLAFSQLLLIWSGNLLEEIPYYLKRWEGGWKAASVALLLAHFAVPFLLLLSAGLKKKARTLSLVAGWLLAMRWLDYYWSVVPGHGHHLVTGLWIDGAALVGVGGLWLWRFFAELEKRPLLPLGDPYLEEALSHD